MNASLAIACITLRARSLHRPPNLVFSKYVKKSKATQRERAERCARARPPSLVLNRIQANSVVQINVVKGCVNYDHAHATFDHVYLDSRVESSEMYFQSQSRGKQD